MSEPRIKPRDLPEFLLASGETFASTERVAQLLGGTSSACVAPPRCRSPRAPDRVDHQGDVGTGRGGVAPPRSPAARRVSRRPHGPSRAPPLCGISQRRRRLRRQPPQLPDVPGRGRRLLPRPHDRQTDQGLAPQPSQRNGPRWTRRGHQRPGPRLVQLLRGLLPPASCMPSQRAPTNISSDGRCRSSNDCEANPPKRKDGSTPPVSASHNSSLTGTSSLQPHAGLWEPYDGRLSRTVPREREGEVPSRHHQGGCPRPVRRLLQPDMLQAATYRTPFDSDTGSDTLGWSGCSLWPLTCGFLIWWGGAKGN